MDLQKALDEKGYPQAVADLEGLKEQRDLLAGYVKEVAPEFVEEGLQLLAHMNEQIEQCQAALDAQYAATVKRIDAENDLDFAMLDMEERAELVLEYMEKDHPDLPATAEIRKIVEAIRNNEKYEPEKPDVDKDR